MRTAPLLLCLACTPEPATTPDTGMDYSTGSSLTGGPGTTAYLRVVVWNIQGVGRPGSVEYEAALAVLKRLDADIVGINEVDEYESNDLDALAADLGLARVANPSTNPFGGLHNALLTRMPVLDLGPVSAADLSGDPSANDVTRSPVSLTLQDGTVFVVNHFKAGFDDIDEFRRSCDAVRTAQATGDGPARVVMGDMNHEVADGFDFPSTFTSIPSGAPSGFDLGQDLAAALSDGLANNPFAHLEGSGLYHVEAAQKDGRTATRDSSGRQIDYFSVSGAVADRILGAEVYDARDEHLDGGLPKPGPAPTRESTYEASDHFPLILDLSW